MSSSWIFPKKLSASTDAAKCFAKDTELAQDTNTHTCTHTFVSSQTELPQLDDGIRADTGRPARLRAMAPSSGAVVCLTTRRTGEETGARATATPYPLAVWHGNHCHSPDISPGQRWWLSAPAAGLCLSRSLQPNTSRACSIRGTGPCT